MNEKLKKYLSSSCEIQEIGFWELQDVDILLQEEIRKIQAELDRRTKDK